MPVKKEGTSKKKQTRKRVSKIPPWKDRTAILLGALTIALAIVFALVLPDFIREYSGSDTSVQADAADELELPGYRHPITGALLYEPVEPPQLFGVMIDNHEAAWPPSGIEHALLVVEAPVEASISRMLAFFSENQEIDEIGPVRSARPYYLDWNDELDAAYVHVGGSNAALDQIASGGTFDMNQYWWGEYFWRDDYRSAPHNVYTSSEDLLSFLEEREEAGKAPEVLYGLWQFKDAQELEGDPVGLYIDFWAPVYAVDWAYDSESRQYVRDQGGEPHVTRSGEQIVADNVAVVITDIEVIDNVGRRDVRTTGEGKGYVLQDGAVIEATWKKRSETERLRFYDQYDKEILMNAGVTWIEVVPDEESISFTE